MLCHPSGIYQLTVLNPTVSAAFSMQFSI